MTNSMKSLCLAAAVAGLLGGASTLINAQPVAGHVNGCQSQVSSAIAGAPPSGKTSKPKHACKGKNDCKGQGADGKNSCKGKGAARPTAPKPPMPKM